MCGSRRGRCGGARRRGSGGRCPPSRGTRTRWRPPTPRTWSCARTTRATRRGRGWSGRPLGRTGGMPGVRPPWRPPRPRPGSPPPRRPRRPPRPAGPRGTPPVNASPAPVESTGRGTGRARTRAVTTPPAATTAPRSPRVTTTSGNVPAQLGRRVRRFGQPGQQPGLVRVRQQQLGPLGELQEALRRPAPRRNPADAGSTLTGTPRSRAVRRASSAVARLARGEQEIAGQVQPPDAVQHRRRDQSSGPAAARPRCR